MTVSPINQIPWPRIVAEGIIIVVSILLAFAAEAWWTARQLQEDEREVLQLLDAEFAEVDTVLAEWQSNQQGILEACEELLRYTGPELLQPPSRERTGFLMWQGIIFVWAVNPPIATLRSLESSGRLTLVGNQDILGGLAEWQSLLEDLQEDEAMLKQYTYQNIFPALAAKLAWRNISAFSNDPLYNGGPSKFPDGLLEILSDREFEGHVDEKRTETINILENYRVIRAALQELRSLIQLELQA